MKKIKNLWKVGTLQLEFIFHCKALWLLSYFISIVLLLWVQSITSFHYLCI